MARIIEIEGGESAEAGVSGRRRIVMKCCMCRRVYGARESGHECGESETAYSHGYCPECFAHAMQSLDPCVMAAP